MTTVLPRVTVLRLLAVLAVVLAPHVAHVPPWVSGLAAAALAWRAAVALRGWRLPGRLVRALLAAVGLAAVYASFGRISGQTAGVALLVVMTALKLTELRGRRDATVLVFLMYFLLITHFLFSQEPWTAAFLLTCAVLITWVLIAIHRDLPGRQTGDSPVHDAFPSAGDLRLATVMIGQSLPLMLVMFVLFPRIPGPLWGLPADSGAAVSGLADSMAPGDIERVVKSDAVAFRVRFDGPVPPPRARYWRGPVFAFFDGRRWTPGRRPPAAPATVHLLGAPYRYEITLEPDRQRWLFALDLPDPASLPADAQVDADAVLLAAKRVDQRRLYRLRSYTRYRLQPHLPAALRETFLQLPLTGDPRARRLAGDWRRRFADDRDVIDAALRWFRDGGFRYTLHPPPLGRDPVDDFLFHTRAGFCEHYASAFTFLMRAAGIPARVVTGYQGGELNPVGDYLVVRESDAHAWSEVWLTSAGWVRVDPTAAVAPSRIQDGIDAALAGSAGLPDYLDAARTAAWRYALEARWDWLNAQWNRWVLAYGPELQQRLLARLGLMNWRDAILALTAAIGLLLAAIGTTVIYGARPRRETDAALQLWQQALQRLARLGIQPQPAEGPRDFAIRAAGLHPELAGALQALSDAYLRCRYLGRPALSELAAAVAALKARRGSPTDRRTKA